jgi:hypothetical protein
MANNYRHTPHEQLLPSVAARKRKAALRKEQEARQLRYDADEAQRRWERYQEQQRQAQASA